MDKLQTLRVGLTQELTACHYEPSTALEADAITYKCCDHLVGKACKRAEDDACVGSPAQHMNVRSSCTIPCILWLYRYQLMLPYLLTSRVRERRHGPSALRPL